VRIRLAVLREMTCLVFGEPVVEIEVQFQFLHLAFHQLGVGGGKEPDRLLRE
jgi:hypothetical protein